MDGYLNLSSVVWSAVTLYVIAVSSQQECVSFQTGSQYLILNDFAGNSLYLQRVEKMDADS